MSYDWVKIKKEILAETRDVFSSIKSINVEEALETLRKVLEFPDNQPKLKLYKLPELLNGLERILVQNEISGDSFTALALPYEAYLKKILYLVNPTFYLGNAHNITLGDKFDKNKNLIANGLIRELDLNPNNLSYWLRSLPATKHIIDEHLWRSYNLRNDLAHFCKSYNKKEFWTGVQSYLVMYLYAAHIHRQALLAAVEPYFLSSYLQNYIIQYRQWQTQFVPMPGIEFERIDQWASEVPEEELQNQGQDKPEDEKKRPNPNRPQKTRRSGTIEDLRHSITEKQMVIIAEPGMGKSTSLQYIAYTDAQAIENGQTDTPYPIYIELKEFQTGDIIQNRIVRKLDIDAGVVNNLLENGKVILLLDGLNEVAETHREEAIKAIQRFMTDFQNVFVIITSRPNAYERSYFDNIGGRGKAPIFQLQLMELPQIEEFLQKNSKNEATGIILKAIEGNEALKNIIKTPLLLKMLIALVSREPNTAIPQTETGIILDFINGICNWEKEQNASFNQEEFLDRLAYLAHQTRMQNEANTAIAEEAILHILRQKAPEWKLKESLNKAVELRLLVHEKADNRYSFVHEVYQEALWAKQQVRFDAYLPAVDSGIQYTPSVKLWHNPGFKEALRLYSALLQGKQRMDFVSEIAKRNVLLAARCKTASWHPEPELREMIIERAKLFAVFFEDALEWCVKGLIALIELGASKELKMVITEFEKEIGRKKIIEEKIFFSEFISNSSIKNYLSLIVFSGENRFRNFFELLCINLDFQENEACLYEEQLMLISELLYSEKLYEALILLEQKIPIPLALQNFDYINNVFDINAFMSFSMFISPTYFVIPNSLTYTIDVVVKYKLTHVLTSKWYIELHLNNGSPFDLANSNIEKLLYAYSSLNLGVSYFFDYWCEWIKKNPVLPNMDIDFTVEYPMTDGLNDTQVSKLIKILETTGFQWELNYAIFLRTKYSICDQNRFNDIYDYVIFVLSHNIVSDNFLSASLANKYNLIEMFPLEIYVQAELNMQYYSKAIDIMDKFDLYFKFDLLKLCEEMYFYLDDYGEKIYVYELKKIIDKFQLQDNESLKDIISDITKNNTNAIKRSFEIQETLTDFDLIENSIARYLESKDLNLAKWLLTKFYVEERGLQKNLALNFINYRFFKKSRLISDIAFAFKYAKLIGNEDYDFIQQIFQEVLKNDELDIVYEVLKTYNAPIEVIEVLLNKAILNSKLQISIQIVTEYFLASKYELILLDKTLENNLSFAKDCIKLFKFGQEYKERLFIKAIEKDIAFAFECIIDLALDSDKLALVYEHALKCNLSLANDITKLNILNIPSIIPLFQRAIEVDTFFAFEYINEYNIETKQIVEAINSFVINAPSDLIKERIQNYYSSKIGQFYTDSVRPKVWKLEDFLRNYVLGLEKIWAKFYLHDYISFEKFGECIIYIDFQTTKKIIDKYGLCHKLYKQKCEENAILNVDVESKLQIYNWHFLCDYLLHESEMERFLVISNFLNIYVSHPDFYHMLNINWIVFIFNINVKQEICPTILKTIEKGYIQTVKNWSDNINLQDFCLPEIMIAKALDVGETELAQYWVEKYNLYEQFPQIEPPGEAAVQDAPPPEEA